MTMLLILWTAIAVLAAVAIAAATPEVLRRRRQDRIYRRISIRFRVQIDEFARGIRAVAEASAAAEMCLAELDAGARRTAAAIQEFGDAWRQRVQR